LGLARRMKEQESRQHAQEHERIFAALQLETHAVNKTSQACYGENPQLRP